jgi:hypothetical protein
MTLSGENLKFFYNVTTKCNLSRSVLLFLYEKDIKTGAGCKKTTF